MRSLNIALLVLISHLLSFVFGTSPPTVVFSSPTKFQDGGSEIKFPSSTHPEYTKCKQSFGFINCQNFTNYPSEFMKKLVSEEKNAGLFQWCRKKKLSDAKTKPNSTSPDPYITAINPCKSKPSDVSPQGIVVNGTFYYVIQAESNDVECYQKFSVVQCINNSDENRTENACKIDNTDFTKLLVDHKWFKFECVQIYALYEDLMVISKNNEILKINVPRPSCCSCKYQQCEGVCKP